MAQPGRGGRLTPAPERLSLPAGGLRFDALAAGPEDGPLVLLLHGFPQSSHQWRNQLPVLAAAGFRAVAPDQRGYSPEARPEGVAAYHVDRLVEDVLALADALGAGPFHLVGHDWGAIVAWVAAARHGGRLRSLTAVSTPHPLAMAEALGSPTGDQARRSAYVNLFRLPKVPERLLLAGEGGGLRKLFWNTGYTDREAVEEYVRLLDGPAAVTAALNWYRAVDLGTLAGVGPVEVPTLYVWSTDDPALGREAAERTAAYVRGRYRFVELAGVSHWVPEDSPADLNVELLAHLGAAGA
ncbi:MAG TPA: alpha/beta fold hydrolase [Acidimicrobiales bacterium]|jgi:pimeloyl-ACP methyl ester carboxylesterase|nr:alpha/beta fold hydrolase [Acidimicrobiales bacterium]